MQFGKAMPDFERPAGFAIFTDTGTFRSLGIFSMYPSPFRTDEVSI
jgi:hypothetical protein